MRLRTGWFRHLRRARPLRCTPSSDFPLRPCPLSAEPTSGLCRQHFQSGPRIKQHQGGSCRHPCRALPPPPHSTRIIRSARQTQPLAPLPPPPAAALRRPPPPWPRGRTAGTRVSGRMGFDIFHIVRYLPQIEPIHGRYEGEWARGRKHGEGLEQLAGHTQARVRSRYARGKGARAPTHVCVCVRDARAGKIRSVRVSRGCGKSCGDL
jgi:hypothetical protein